MTRQLNFLAAFHNAFVQNPDLPSRAAYRSCYSHKISKALLERASLLEVSGQETIPVIFQVKEEYHSEVEHLRKLLERNPQIKALRVVKGYCLGLTPGQIFTLISSPKVDYATEDAPIFISGEDCGKELFAPLVERNSEEPQRESGIGVAVLDSAVSIDASLACGRVRLTLDFISEGSQESLGSVEKASDHGTQVASVIASKGTHRKDSEDKALEILALRVVDDTERGTTGDLIRAVDWILENRDSFGIRVANLSLTHKSAESHLRDPLCQAVRAMVEAGIVVIASVGGRRGEDYAWWVGSPGIEPSAITVAAEAQGLREFKVPETSPDRNLDEQGLFKPDLCVNGGVESDSLAAASVTSAVVRMLDVNQSLNPTMVKSILLCTAQQKASSSGREEWASIDEAAALQVVTALQKQSA
jgi:serine protease AprX